MADTFGGNSRTPVPQATQPSIPMGGGYGQVGSQAAPTTPPLTSDTQTPTGPTYKPLDVDSSPSVPSSINSSNLSPQTPVNVGTPPQVAGNGFTEGAQATIDTLNKQISDLKAQQATTDTGNLQDLFTKYLGSSSAPPSSADAYNSLYNSSGIADKQAAYTKSQNELDALNAQLNGKQYEYNTVIPNQTQQDAQGRGVTVGGLAPITAAAQRQKLLEIAPLQLQILSKQAEVTGNANILNAAQAHVDKVFQIQQQDAQSQYQYKQNVIDKIYQFASDQEKAKLDQQKTQNDQNFQLMRDAMNNAQDIAKTAMENGQSDIASQILGLDPQSPTYKQDVAKLQAKVDAAKLTQNVEEIGGRKVLISYNNKGDVVKKTDLGPSTSTAKSPGAISFSPTDKTALISAGETASSIAKLESDLNQYGAQTVLDNGQGLSDATKTWIEDTYNVQPTKDKSQNKGLFGLGFLGL